MKYKKHIILFMLLMATWINCTILYKKQKCTSEQHQLDIESFEYIWKTMYEKHYDPTFGGLNWKLVHDTLRPKIEKVHSRHEARMVMNQMIGTLGLSHFNLIPAELYKNINEEREPGDQDGVTGIDIRVIDNHALVTHLEKDSPAEKAGIKMGWEIKKIGKKEISSRLPIIEKEFEGKSWQNLIVNSFVKSQLSGKIGESTNIEFLDGENRSILRTVKFAQPKGNKFQFGYMPRLYVWSKTDTLEDRIGYFAFNGFFDPLHVMKSFNEAMKSFLNFEGIIIDIRGNPGGLAAIATGMSGWFINEKEQILGTMYTRDTNLKFVVQPRPQTYSGSVVVLVDGLSGSCAEIFSGGLKDNKRAQIIGRTTAGAALPSIIEKLPNGDGFQYAIANYISAGGDMLEGVGVRPHIHVEHTRKTLLQGRDVVLEEGIKWILQNQGRNECDR